MQYLDIRGQVTLQPLPHAADTVRPLLAASRQPPEEWGDAQCPGYPASVLSPPWPGRPHPAPWSRGTWTGASPPRPAGTGGCHPPHSPYQ